MDYKKLAIGVCLILIFSISVNAQVKSKIVRKVDPVAAQEKYKNGDYRNALEDYLILIEKESQNEEFNSVIATCYLKTNIDKAKAIPYLEFLLKQDKVDPNVFYDLGAAYHYANRFDDAINILTKFKQKGKGKSENLKNVDRIIQYCINAKEFMKFPQDVTFDNVGKNINSPYPDYYPFVPEDESIVIYNSRRGGSSAVKDIDGNYTSGIFVGRLKDGDFQKAKNIGPPINNGEGDQEVVGMSANGEYLLVWKYDALLGAAGLFVSTLDKTKNFKRAEAFDEPINTFKEREISACITNDGNTVFLAAERAGTFGHKDIYVSKRLPTGKWSQPQNMGSNINTELDEDFPNLSPDEKTLFFCSDGLTSMGGFDIFKSEWDEKSESWGKPVNMGYPVNTTYDDFCFRLSGNGRYGYVSQVREGGQGDMDIYRITFNKAEPKYTVVKGMVSFADTLQKVDFRKVSIIVTDVKTGKRIGKYAPNPITGSYIIIVPPGEYDTSIEIPGFETMRSKIELADKIGKLPEIEKDFVVSKQAISENVLPDKSKAKPAKKVQQRY